MLMDVVAKLPVKEVDMMINREKLWEKTRINVVVILFFAGIMLIGLITMRKLLISNANSMSKLLLDNYASKEEDIMDTYENILIICTRYIEEKEAENASLEEIKSGLYPYLTPFVQSEL
jgi:hypothetical protein